jgi:hypothetical protein
MLVILDGSCQQQVIALMRNLLQANSTAMQLPLLV